MLFRKDVKFYMSWPTKFTGIQIDTALEKAQMLRVVNNGWIRINSSNTSPTCLGDIKDSGNYITSFWTDGPDLGGDVVIPLNITVTKFNEDTYQFVKIAGNTYNRVLKSGESLYSAWNINHIASAINPGPEIPGSAVDGETLWLDTSNASVPTLKLYINGEWKEIFPDGALQLSVYDPNGKNTDIFKYIDDAILAAPIEDASIDYESHINDNTLHVSETDRTKWNSAATNAEVRDAVITLKSEMLVKVEETVSADINEVESLTSTANELKTSIDKHIADDKIHPSAEMQANWDSKADINHNHIFDNRVTIDNGHINGEIPNKVIPYDVQERVYDVNSLEEMYRLEKNPVHNGDLICINTIDTTTWYFVVDDSYLGTNEASKAFKKLSSEPELDWNKVVNRPNTISDYGINDAVTREELESVQNSIDSMNNSLPEIIDFSGINTIKPTYISATSNLAYMDIAVSTLDPAVTLLESMTF